MSDVIRPEVAEQLAMLKQAGAKHLVMLTGDNQMTADYVADMLGIDEVHAELLPDEKVQFVKNTKNKDCALLSLEMESMILPLWLRLISGLLWDQERMLLSKRVTLS